MAVGDFVDGCVGETSKDKSKTEMRFCDATRLMGVVVLRIAVLGSSQSPTNRPSGRGINFCA